MNKKDDFVALRGYVTALGQIISDQAKANEELRSRILSVDKNIKDTPALNL